MQAVLDTNVVVSALIWGGNPFRLLEAASDSKPLLFTSPVLLSELRSVLAREHLVSRLEQQRSSVETALILYQRLATSVSPEYTPRVVLGDPDDDHVIAAGLTAKADLIVSGDRHLLALGTHQGIRILTPAGALALIED